MTNRELDGDHEDDDPPSPDTGSERLIAHFTEWFEQSPSTFRFWEVLLTSDRLVLCFVGESYQSVLLKADMGAQRRRELRNLTIDEVATRDENNVVVPTTDLTEIRFTGSSLLKRSSLTFEWQDASGERFSRTLYNVKGSDDQMDAVLELETEADLDHVDITADERGYFF